MERPSLQLSVTAMLLLVACVALNLWLFRLGPLVGIIGLNLTKHVAIAGLCQILGVNRRTRGDSKPPAPAARPIPISAPEAQTRVATGEVRRS